MRSKTGLLVFALVLVAVAGLCAQTELKAVVSLSLPPYIMQDTDNGLEVDIVRQALKPAGYTVSLSYVPFARIPVAMKDRTADCALTINEGSGLTGVFYSDSHITYQNVAVGLKSKALKIKTVTDLGAYRVLAFGDAPLYLGPEFAAMAKSNSKYSEIADQANQVKLLYLGRADLVIMDVNIFKYFQQKTAEASGQDFVVYELFPPTAYKVAFTSKDIRDKFNAGVKQLRDSGAYAAIFKNYIK